MKLYYAPGSCSLAITILAREIGCRLVLVRVDLATGRTDEGADYLGINGKGVVPLLELDDGTRLTEGPVIAQYLGDFYRATDLMPVAGTLARYRVMEWQNFITSELHKQFGPLFGLPKLSPESRAMYAGILLRRLRWVDSHLEGRRFLTGERFTAADAYLFAICVWTRIVGPGIDTLTNLTAWMRRVAARPAVQDALLAEGLEAA